jgi:hypothetical protein
VTNAAITASLPDRASEFASAPRLRLLPKRAPGSAARAAGEAGRAGDGRDGGPNGYPPVLVAGADAAARGRVRRELGELMPPGTRFEEAGTFWQVLERAPMSRIVVLSGELDELPAGSLRRSLGHRHPDLPLISLEPPLALR